MGKALSCLGLMVALSFGCGGSGSGIGVDSTCANGDTLAKNLLSALGKDHLLIGAAMEDEIAAQAPFDLRYLYLAGGISDGAEPCSSCVGCTTNWWGCWQWDQLPPGQYVTNFIENAAANSQIPMFTYYEIYQSSGVAEGAETVAKANDAAFMSRYLNDWRFALQKVGEETVLLHIEPDFWGYAQQTNSDPMAIPAAVVSANPTDCADLPNTIAGLGQCMIAMVRRYAPNAKVGLHASGWGTGIAALANSDGSFDVEAEASKIGAFFKACGSGDFVVADLSDRDAADSGLWWDETNATLPNFHQGNSWARALSEEMRVPVLWWQVPVGTGDRDNRLDYFFGHMGELAAANVAGVAYGAGISGQTTPSTDGGNLVSKTKAYIEAGGQPACD